MGGQLCYIGGGIGHQGWSRAENYPTGSFFFLIFLFIIYLLCLFLAV